MLELRDRKRSCGVLRGERGREAPDLPGARTNMPYELSFTKHIQVDDDSAYINECCFGGDIVSDMLLPQIRNKYMNVQANQEDWGWFIWFKGNESKLAIDIFCDDRESGSFRIHLTSRKKGWLGDKVVDTQELESLKDETISKLKQWVEGSTKIERLDSKYMPFSA